MNRSHRGRRILLFCGLQRVRVLLVNHLTLIHLRLLSAFTSVATTWIWIATSSDTANTRSRVATIWETAIRESWSWRQCCTAYCRFVVRPDVFRNWHSVNLINNFYWMDNRNDLWLVTVINLFDRWTYDRLYLRVTIMARRHTNNSFSVMIYYMDDACGRVVHLPR